MTWPDVAIVTPWAVDDYIREEVRRQGHDLNAERDGGLRVLWMRRAWYEARRVAYANPGCAPSRADIEEIARTIEPFKNKDGFRRCGVRVGWRVCPAPTEVPRLVAQLLKSWGTLPALDWYREFELIHPFRDGNGRTGKVLLAWHSGTFDAPYFPPADLFGEEIANP